MRATHLPFPALVALAFATGATALSAGCAKTDTVGQSFENLGGSGGNGTGGDEQGGSGTGGDTTTSTSTSTTSTTSTSTTTTSSTSTTTTTTTTTGPTCTDTGAEPNDTEATAKSLGTIDDCDGSGESFAGVLNGPADVDWYKYNGQDSFGCVVGASRTVSFMMPARICKYAQCIGAAAEVTCPGSATGDTSPDGRPGCCSGNGFDMDIECPGVDDNATIYLRIDNPQAGDCIPYSVSYHY